MDWGVWVVGKRLSGLLFSIFALGRDKICSMK